MSLPHPLVRFVPLLLGLAARHTAGMLLIVFTLKTAFPLVAKISLNSIAPVFTLSALAIGSCLFCSLVLHRCRFHTVVILDTDITLIALAPRPDSALQSPIRWLYFMVFPFMTIKRSLILRRSPPAASLPPHTQMPDRSLKSVFLLTPADRPPFLRYSLSADILVNFDAPPTRLVQTLPTIRRLTLEFQSNAAPPKAPRSSLLRFLHGLVLQFCLPCGCISAIFLVLLAAIKPLHGLSRNPQSS